jgi:hypothetical protein
LRTWGKPRNTTSWRRVPDYSGLLDEQVPGRPRIKEAKTFLTLLRQNAPWLAAGRLHFFQEGRLSLLTAGRVIQAGKTPIRHKLGKKENLPPSRRRARRSLTILMF